MVFGRPFFNRMPEVGVEGRLSDDNGIFKTGQRYQFINIFGDIAFITAITVQPDNFRMILVTNDYGSKSFFQMLFDNRLHPDHPRAGCIDNVKAYFF